MLMTAFKFCFQIQVAPLHRGPWTIWRGEHVQLEPGLTVLGFQLLKLRCDEPLSNLAFNLGLPGGVNMCESNPG